jgi:hypothetical protein
MICREVLDNLIDGCNELGIEQEMITHWEDQRASYARIEIREIEVTFS